MEERAKLLQAVADRIEAEIDEFARAESIDSGKPVARARTVELPRAVANFRFFASSIVSFSSESHATDMCAGMAKTGLKPFATIYSTFLQRGFDQIFQEVALQELPVRFCMDRGGLVGGDGAVHHGFLDVAFLRGFPKMVLMAAMD